MRRLRVYRLRPLELLIHLASHVCISPASRLLGLRLDARDRVRTGALHHLANVAVRKLPGSGRLWGGLRGDDLVDAPWDLAEDENTPQLLLAAADGAKERKAMDFDKWCGGGGRRNPQPD